MARFLQLTKVSKASFSKRHFVIVFRALLVLEYLTFDLQFLQLVSKFLKLNLAIQVVI